jgi:hypothetical protein
MDIKEVTNLIETVLAASNQASRQTEERWAKAFEEQVKLRREELDTQLKIEAFQAETKRLESEAKSKNLQETARMVAPLMAAAGAGLSEYLKRRGEDPSPTSSSTPSSEASSPPPSSGDWRVSTESIDEWCQQLVLMLPKLKPNTKALLRTFFLSWAADQWEDPPPSVEVAQLIHAMRDDLGDEAVLNFVRLTDLAWTRPVIN